MGSTSRRSTRWARTAGWSCGGVTLIKTSSRVAGWISMRLFEREIVLPPAPAGAPLLAHLAGSVAGALADGEVPVRFAVTQTGPEGHHCELGVMGGLVDGQAAA